MFDVHPGALFLLELDGRDDPVLVPANVEDRQMLDLVGTGKRHDSAHHTHEPISEADIM